MNATSITPPNGTPGVRPGSPVAYGVAFPVLGSMRVIWPIAPSATYSAPSGPIVPPIEPCRPEASSVAPDGRVAATAPAVLTPPDRTINATARATAHIRTG